MTAFMAIEHVTIREIGGTLYIKVPNILKEETKVKAGDKAIWHRSTESKEFFGLEVSQSSGESNPS